TAQRPPPTRPSSPGASATTIRKRRASAVSGSRCADELRGLAEPPAPSTSEGETEGMKTRHWWLAVAPLVCSVGVVLADNVSAQVDPERLAALRAMTGQARALAERMPEPARRALSSSAMNLMNLAERWPHLEQSLTLRRPAGSRAAPALPR